MTQMYGPAAFRKRDRAWGAEVADMYPAYLIGSRAVALMGIRTHRCLISDRLTSNHLGHQTLDAIIDPSHALSLANSGKIQIAITPSGGVSNVFSLRRMIHAIPAICWPGPLPACCDAASVLRSVAMFRS
jgi:hypothetical protein